MLMKDRLPILRVMLRCGELSMVDPNPCGRPSNLGLSRRCCRTLLTVGALLMTLLTVILVMGELRTICGILLYVLVESSFMDLSCC